MSDYASGIIPEKKKEYYLAYLNGLNDYLPLPVTKEERYLYELCMNGGLGGGTSINILGELASTSELPSTDAEKGDAYIINGELWVYSGSALSSAVNGFSNCGRFTAGNDGQDGEDGEDGKSAYDIWLDAGNTGSEEDFLESLKGKNGDSGTTYTPVIGTVTNTTTASASVTVDATTQEAIFDFGLPQGASGENAYQIALDNGFVGTEQEWLDSLKADTAEIETIVDKNIINTVGYFRKNLLKNTSKTQSMGGVLFTTNEDKSITVNGSHSSDVSIIVGTMSNIPDGEYIISGCPQGGSTTTYKIGVYYKKIDGSVKMITSQIGGELKFKSELQQNLDKYTSVYVQIVVYAGTVMDNLTFYPMIRDAKIVDSTYEPYINSVEENINELQENIENHESNISLINTTLGYEKKNLLQVTMGTRTMNGITFTKNNDGTITLDGTAVEETENAITNNAAIFKVTDLSLSAGKYILSGCPSGGSLTTYRLYVYCSTDEKTIASDFGDGIEFTIEDGKDYMVNLLVKTGITVSSLVFSPMIRDAKINDSDFEAYMPNIQERINEIEKTHSFATFTTPEQLGITTLPTTTPEIFLAMPNNSMVMMMGQTNTLSDRPDEKAGLLIIYKKQPERFSIIYQPSQGTLLSDANMYVGKLKGTDGSDFSWKKVLTEENFVYETINSTTTTYSSLDDITVSGLYHINNANSDNSVFKDQFPFSIIGENDFYLTVKKEKATSVYLHQELVCNASGNIDPLTKKSFFKLSRSTYSAGGALTWGSWTGFGITSDGNYGYLKAGDTSITAF